MPEIGSFVALGDSFTEGLGDPYADGPGTGWWADRFAERLAAGRPGLRYANLAVRGKVMGEVAAEQVPLAIAMVPDLVSVAAGAVVHGSIFRFEGQVTVFDPYNGPCYRCLLPEPPPPELAPSCSEAGVIGVLPGIIGSIQALEAIKIVLDLGEPLRGRLLAYDALEETFRNFKVRRDPTCPACGEGAQIVIAEYDDLCMPHATLADGTVTGHCTALSCADAASSSRDIALRTASVHARRGRAAYLRDDLDLAGHQRVDRARVEERARPW